MFLDRDDVEVKFIKAIDLAYKGSKRNGTIGQAHHTVHYNFASQRSRAVSKYSTNGLRSDDEKSKAKEELNEQMAVLFNLTMHQAISEVGCSKAVFAKRLVDNSNAMSRTSTGDPIYRYPKSFAAVSPSRMHGSFTAYLAYLQEIREDLYTNLPHDNIVHAVCELTMPNMIEEGIIEEWSNKLGCEVKQNHDLWQTIDIQREVDESWISYFRRKGEAIATHDNCDELVGHMLFYLASSSTEYAGVLFATLDTLNLLEKLEE
tara:strand:- start:2203 stop:2985 length:783 start_codon:yes stop_codon:yes gene_type:complete